jgi:hypothetical protein
VYFACNIVRSNGQERSAPTVGCREQLAFGTDSHAGQLVPLARQALGTARGQPGFEGSSGPPRAEAIYAVAGLGKLMFGGHS